jgi:hypothetical protein
MNLPDPGNNGPLDIMKAPLNVLDFIFDKSEDVVNDTPFRYYSYNGSMT